MEESKAAMKELTVVYHNGVSETFAHVRELPCIEDGLLKFTTLDAEHFIPLGVVRRYSLAPDKQ